MMRLELQCKQYMPEVSRSGTKVGPFVGADSHRPDWGRMKWKGQGGVRPPPTRLRLTKGGLTKGGQQALSLAASALTL